MEEIGKQGKYAMMEELFLSFLERFFRISDSMYSTLSLNKEEKKINVHVISH